jgi:hypothetical protein
LDQGDVIDNCAILTLASFHAETGSPETAEFGNRRVIVLTQTCDFANSKTDAVNVGEVFDAQFLVDAGYFKPSDIKGPVRAGRVWGWYFLPADTALGLPEMIVDLRRLHTIRLDLLVLLCKYNQRRGRVRPLYREHLAKHFADTFSRIGLPRPYETM